MHDFGHKTLIYLYLLSSFVPFQNFLKLSFQQNLTVDQLDDDTNHFEFLNQALLLALPTIHHAPL